MAKRERVDFTPAIERLGVEADAGNAFVSPEAVQGVNPNAGRNAQRLAAALSGLNSKLQGFVRENITEANRQTRENRATFIKEERARGAAARAAAEAGDAVRARIIPPNASPYFIQGVKEQNARIAGDAYHQTLSQSLLDLNPVDGDINAHITEQSSAFVEVNPDLKDPTTFAEFQRRQAGIEQATRATFLSQQGRALRKRKADLTFTESTNMVSAAQLRAIESKTPLDLKLLGGRLTELAASDRFLGQDGSVTNRAISEAVIKRALESRNVRLLDALGHTARRDFNGKPIIAMSRTPEIADQILKAREQIRRDQERSEDRLYRKRNEERTEAGFAVSNLFGSRFSENPEAEVTPEEFARYRKLVPNFDERVRKMRGIFTETPAIPAPLEDKDSIEYLIDKGLLSHTDLVNAAKVEGIDTEMGNLRINAGEYGTLARRITSARNAAKKGENILRFPAVAEAEKDALRSLAPPTDATGAYLKGVDRDAIRRWQGLAPVMRQRWKKGFEDFISGKEAVYLNSPGKLQGVIAEYNREFLKNHESLVEKVPGEREQLRRKLELDVPMSGAPTSVLRRAAVQYQRDKTGPMADEIRRLWPDGVDQQEFNLWVAKIKERLQRKGTK